MFVPAETAFSLIDRICVGCEDSRRLSLGVFALSMLVGFVGFPPYYAEVFSAAFGTVFGSMAGVGYVSLWRGWGK